MSIADMRLLYVVTKNKKEAQLIARNLVDQNFVACANLIDSISSVYRWKGDIVEDQETLLILKTKKTNVEQIIDKIKQLHSYECPAIITLPVEGGFEPYLQWIDEQC